MEENAPRVVTDHFAEKNYLPENLSFLYNYLLKKRLIIFFAGLLAGLLTLLFSFYKKPYYTAESTFVLESGGSSGLGQYSSLAALAGFSVDNGGGVFSGDNIAELYDSRMMLEKTLLSKATSDSSKMPLIDRYIAGINYWRKFKGIGSFNFNQPKKNFNKAQDSILFEIAKEIKSKYLNIGKLDKKNVISISVKSKDELFAKDFNEKLVENVNQMYILIKSKKAQQNVAILQHQLDSTKKALNFDVVGAAAAIDATPNSNPFQQTLKAPSQRKSIDIQAGTAVYAELVKNLELARISLLKETPLIQIIDQPELPLEKEKISKVIYGLAGFFGGAMAAVLFLLIAGSRRFVKKQV